MLACPRCVLQGTKLKVKRGDWAVSQYVPGNSWHLVPNPAVQVCPGRETLFTKLPGLYHWWSTPVQLCLQRNGEHLLFHTGFRSLMECTHHLCDRW